MRIKGSLSLRRKGKNCPMRRKELSHEKERIGLFQAMEGKVCLLRRNGKVYVP